MKSYRALIFWFGGVLTSSLVDRTLTELAPAARGSAAVTIRKQLRHLSGELALGSLTPQDYCQGAVLACHSGLPASELAPRITASAGLDQAVAGLVREIAASQACWLLVDYPAGWYQELAARWELSSLFPDDRMIYTADLKLTRLSPDIFYLLPQRIHQPMAECLVIDPVSGRAVEAMRHGLATIIYVYPARLKHELALQGIWQTGDNVMHPAASERVNL